jgi:hypothetical protein
LGVGLDVVGRFVGAAVGIFVGPVGCVVGTFVGPVGWDVGVVCNFRLVDSVTIETLSAAPAVDSLASKPSCSSFFTKQGVLSLFQACAEFNEPGAYSSFEHILFFEIH